MIKNLTFLNNAKLKLKGVLEKHNNKSELTIILQGYGQTSKHFVFLNKLLRKDKINFFLFDLSGCGESEGNFSKQNISSWTDDLVAAIDFVKKLGFKRVNLFGYSMGGVVCLEAALKRKINKLVLKSPVSNLAKIIEMFYDKQMEQFKNDKKIYYRNFYCKKVYIYYQLYLDSKKHNMLRKAHNISAKTLLMHGGRDTFVPASHTKLLSELMSDSKFLFYKNQGHFLFKTNQLVVDWLK